MIKNYLKVFFRNFGKNKLYYSLNIFGLSIGIACSIIASIYYINQTGFDTFHEDYQNIYRINSSFQMEGKDIETSASLLATGEKLLSDIPEVVAMTRLTAWLQNGALIKVNEKNFPNINALISDTNLLHVFSFEIIEGNPQHFLKGKNEVAITESMAMKVFNTKNAIGKQLWYNEEKYVVSWIMKDPPKNSHLQFDLLFPYDVFPSNYYSLDVFTYIKLDRPITNDIESKINSVAASILKERFADHGTNFKSSLIALHEIYLSGKGQIGISGNKKTLLIFILLASFILLIAIINFINLLTAKSEQRAKEVGLRKVVGAQKRNLRFQFMSETIFIAFLALFFGLVFAEVLSKPLNNLLSANINILKGSPIWFWIGMLFFTILIGCISGLYPAFILSSFKPANVIKGIFTVKGNPNFLKILLVIIQFSIATLLIICILVFITQINYMKEKKLGFDDQNLITIYNSSEKISKSYLSLKRELLLNPNIEKVTASHSIPGYGGSGQFIHLKEKDPKTAISINEYKVQDDFTETFGIQLLEGRSLSYQNYRDSNAFIINEAAAKALGLENPVGKEVVVNRPGKIVGLMKDFHFQSMHREIEPLVLARYSDLIFRITVKIHPEKKMQTIDFIQQKMLEFDKGFYWNYRFISDIFKQQYAVEERMSQIMFYGAMIAILLSILGLFALTAYTINRKYKEIGIRKVQGASVGNIIFLLNKSILRWVIFTNIIAWPLGFYFMNNWLNNFANRISIHVGYFIVAGLISLVIAYLTIVLQARKAALLNPVDVIKHE